MSHEEQLTYADKIAKLLRLAEKASTPQEADAYTAKAQRLMMKYAVSEELLAQAEGRQIQDKIVQEKITYTGIFHMALFDIGRAVAMNNDCKHMIVRYTGKSATDLLIIGYSQDVARVKLLDSSVQIQATIAMNTWYRQQDVSYKTPMQKAKMRREFLFSFARGLNVKLNRARKEGITEAVHDEVTRTGADVDTVIKSTDLVLVSRGERIQDWIDETYGKTLHMVKRNYSSGGVAAKMAGYQAGMNADVGDPRIGGSNKQIGR